MFIVQYQYLKIGLNLAKVQFDRKIVRVAEDIKVDLSTENQLSFLVAQAVTKDNYFNLSDEKVKDASQHFLNDFIKESFIKHGIDTDFTYRLYARDTIDYLHSPNTFSNEEELIRYPISIEGYLPELIQKPLILELQFEDLNGYFLSQLNGLTLPSILFIVAIIIVVIWILRSFYWQSNVITTTNNFINNLTHELKTPVFSIGLATKILEEDMQEKQKPVISMIRQQVERLKKHIDLVLELGNLESRRNLFELTKVDLRPLLIKWCEDFKMIAEVEEIKFQFDIPKEEMWVKAEISHLENAIFNLLDNARKYSENPEIFLKAWKSEKKIIISIKDNGIGISKKEKEHIFKKYYRVSNGNLHKVKGYGLGLSYVKEIVQRHKGTIKVESEENKGTEVSIILPVTHAN